jgi:peroxiredoxin
MLFSMQTLGRLTAGIALCLVVSSTTVAQEIFVYQSVEASNSLVPQHLLALAHAAEVQAEIGVTPANIEKFETGLRAIDRVWWPARLLSTEKQRLIIVELEKKLAQLVQQILGPTALDRLRQLELQAQAIRVLARLDIQQFLKLDNQQKNKVSELFSATDQIAAAIDPIRPDQGKLKELQASKKKEMSGCVELMTPEQSKRLQTVFGKEFNTAQLERIFPLAPELISADNILGAGRSNWSQLKGKVVLVHFYAFECHNCHANFPHYNRWNDKLKSKGVEVIGIQTPETTNESVPANIVKAAKKDGFQFPVIQDLEKQNWNAWGNTMWPTVYVVDKNGYIRFWWQGELNYDGATGDEKIEKLVEKLLSEKS